MSDDTKPTDDTAPTKPETTDEDKEGDLIPKPQADQTARYPKARASADNAPLSEGGEVAAVAPLASVTEDEAPLLNSTQEDGKEIHGRAGVLGATGALAAAGSHTSSYDGNSTAKASTLESERRADGEDLNAGAVLVLPPSIVVDERESTPDTKSGVVIPRKTPERAISITPKSKSASEQKEQTPLAAAAASALARAGFLLDNATSDRAEASNEERKNEGELTSSTREKSPLMVGDFPLIDETLLDTPMDDMEKAERLRHVVRIKSREELPITDFEEEFLKSPVPVYDTKGRPTTRLKPKRRSKDFDVMEISLVAKSEADGPRYSDEDAQCEEVRYSELESEKKDEEDEVVIVEEKEEIIFEVDETKVDLSPDAPRESTLDENHAHTLAVLRWVQQRLQKEREHRERDIEAVQQRTERRNKRRSTLASMDRVGATTQATEWMFDGTALEQIVSIAEVSTLGLPLAHALADAGDEFGHLLATERHFDSEDGIGGGRAESYEVFLRDDDAAIAERVSEWDADLIRSRAATELIIDLCIDALLPTLFNIGNTHRKIKDFESSTASYDEALQLATRLGERGASARAIHEQAVCLEQRIEHERSTAGRRPSNLHDAIVAAYTSALAARSSALGSRHLDVADTLFLRGRAEYRANRLPQALEDHRGALDIRVEVLGPEHPAIAQISATTLTQVAFTLAGMKDYHAAALEADAVLRIRGKTLGPHHPSFGAAAKFAAVMCAKMGDHIAARDRHKMAAVRSRQRFDKKRRHALLRARAHSVVATAMPIRARRLNRRPSNL
ncbi:hypothetical protein CTAYLR_004920 [Chrysophaeum taylorii]|uniref:Uncharacterized protein n=1 Tax=Chrysophaeum taylorii TaxID=2483200 RepID=A0AAD7UQ85_9STRA|nr:hypothetical protein CTAYLR_004920 [Chrysophaeum taylorii]